MGIRLRNCVSLVTSASSLSFAQRGFFSFVYHPFTPWHLNHLGCSGAGRVLGAWLSRAGVRCFGLEAVVSLRFQLCIGSKCMLTCPCKTLLINSELQSSGREGTRLASYSDKHFLPPLVLRGDDLSFDTPCSPQSLLSWIREQECKK